MGQGVTMGGDHEEGSTMKGARPGARRDHGGGLTIGRLTWGWLTQGARQDRLCGDRVISAALP